MPITQANAIARKTPAEAGIVADTITEFVALIFLWHQ